MPSVLLIKGAQERKDSFLNTAVSSNQETTNPNFEVSCLELSLLEIRTLQLKTQICNKITLILFSTVNNIGTFKYRQFFLKKISCVCLNSAFLGLDNGHLYCCDSNEFWEPNLDSDH